MDNKQAIPITLIHKETNEKLEFESMHEAAKSLNIHSSCFSQVLNNPTRSVRGYRVTTCIDLGARQAKIDKKRKEQIRKQEERFKRSTRLSPHKMQFFIFDKKGNFLKICSTASKAAKYIGIDKRLVVRYLYNRHPSDKALIIYTKDFDPAVVKDFLIPASGKTLAENCLTRPTWQDCPGPNSLQYNELKTGATEETPNLN
ncbi:MAG: NUMOD1 domain-containing DNA-binding protein [Candidatus Heimdallarchaeaceae archaeon]